jgi:hypothetical protein
MFMLNSIMMSVVMLNISGLNIILLNVIVMNVIMLNVIMPIVVLNGSSFKLCGKIMGMCSKLFSVEIYNFVCSAMILSSIPCHCLKHGTH